MHDAPKLLLVGCGKMGGALLRRALDPAVARAASPQAYIVDPAPQPDDLKSFKEIIWLASLDKIDPAFAPDIVVLAIKPQHIADVLPGYARFKNAMLLSIAAGVTLGRLASLLRDDNRAIVRAMPNLPAGIGKGMAVAVPNKNVTSRQRQLCERILSLLGDMAWIEDESLLDAVTALSGSGPAYVFALCEAMTGAGQTLGLPVDLAARLARQTIIGSGALLDKTPDSPEMLRRAVTSPGGTTEAALKQLFAENGLRDIMVKAMTAATERGKQLAQSSHA